MTENLKNQTSEEELNVEFYTQSEVLCGRIACPIGFRLLDLFNEIGSDREDSNSGFIEVVNTTNHLKWASFTDAPKEYLRKASIILVAVPDAEAARGLGGKDSLKNYPFVPKLPKPVNIEMLLYSITGTAYLPEGQTIMELLNERTLFIPLTDISITRDHHFFSSRPFGIVNKEHIVSLKEQPFDQSSAANI